jgi:hypothetical protein
MDEVIGSIPGLPPPEGGCVAKLVDTLSCGFVRGLVA